MTKQGLKTFRFELGLVFMLVGVQFGTVLRNTFHFELVNIIMLLSVVLVTNWENLFALKFPKWNKYYFIVFVLNILAYMYSLQNDSSTRDIESWQLYHLYIIASMLALSSHNNIICFRYFKWIILIITSFICVIVGFQVTLGFSGVYSENVLYDSVLDTSQLSEGGDKITMGRALLLCILSYLCFFRENKVTLLGALFFIPLSIIGLIMFNTRACLAVALICIVVLQNKRIKTKITIRKILLRAIPIGVLLIVSYLAIPYFKESIDRIFYSLLQGVFTLLGVFTYGQDESTITRYWLLQKTFNDLWGDNASVSSLLFGHGYMHRYVDVPVIQIFQDIGFIIGGLYIYFKIIFNYRLIKMKSLSNEVILIQLFAIQYLLDQFYCGSPYDVFHWMPQLTLIYLLYGEKRNSSSCINYKLT